MLTRVTAEAGYRKWIFERILAGVSIRTKQSLAIAACNAGLSRVKTIWHVSGTEYWDDFVNYISPESGSTCAEQPPSDCSLLRAAVDCSHRIQAFQQLL
ncbi:MAG: hypothetical protein ACI8XZ_005370 [Gammaproteobacteria bacterium]|jgi:hypothetical protein